jgi:hypothetical protein
VFLLVQTPQAFGQHMHARTQDLYSAMLRVWALFNIYSAMRTVNPNIAPATSGFAQRRCNGSQRYY